MSDERKDIQNNINNEVIKRYKEFMTLNDPASIISIKAISPGNGMIYEFPRFLVLYVFDDDIAFIDKHDSCYVNYAEYKHKYHTKVERHYERDFIEFVMQGKTVLTTGLIYKRKEKNNNEKV